MDVINLIQLEGIGASIWKNIILSGNIELIITTLMSAYNVHEPSLRGDVINFVNQLISQGILERNDADLISTPGG